MSSSRPPATAAVHRLDDYRTAFRRPRQRSEDEVWAEILAAGDLFTALHEAGLTVRFDSATSPPRVRVTDADGRTVRELSLSLVCDPAALEAALLSAPAG